MTTFTLIDTIVLVVYILGVAALGASFGRNQHSTEDYFLGGRSIPWWAIGLSVMATQASAVTFIGAPGWGYEGGLERMNAFLNIPLVMAFLITTLVPFFYRTEVVTAYEYLERRFDTKTRVLSSLLFLISRGLATGVVLFAPALVLSVVTGLDSSVSIVLMAVIAVAYTVLGGISAVIWTDVVQMFVLWFGAALSIFIIVDGLPGDAPGILATASEAGLLQSLNFDLDLSITYGVWAGVIGGFFLQAAYFGADQSQIQRVLTSKSIKQSKLALIVGGFLMFPQMLLFLFIGILLFVFYQHVGPPELDNINELFPRFVVEYLPVGVSGLVIAGVFAAAMSSLDSALNSLAAVTVRDFYAKFFRPNASEAHYLSVSRWATVFWGAYAMAFAFFAGNLGPVIETVNKIGSYFYGALLGVFILAIFSRRATGTGAFAGIVAGMAAVWALTQWGEISWLYNNVVGAGVAVLVGLAVSTFTAPPKPEQVEELTIAGRREHAQAILARRAASAAVVAQEAQDEKDMAKWPFLLAGYFVVTILILLYLESF